MNLYVKIFVFLTVLAAVFTLPIYLPKYGFENGLLASSGFGLFSGIFMTLVMGAFHMLSTRRMGVKGSKIVPHQMEKISLKRDLEKSFKVCINALDTFNANIIDQNLNTHIIHAETKPTLKSWGEIISISLTNEREGQTEIKISSRPKVRTTLIDYGKGLSNVRQLAVLIQEAFDNG